MAGRFRSVLESSIRQRITRLGLLYSLAVVMVGFAAFASANNLLFLLLAAMLSTLLVSGFVSRLSLTGLEIRLAVPEHISARRRFTARLSVRNTKGWIPSFSIHLLGTAKTGFTSAIYFPVIPGGAAIDEVVDVAFSARGRHNQGSFQVSTRFPFGFTERRLPVELSGEVLVYPCLDSREGFEELLTAITGEIASLFRGRGYDFYRIRPYEAFESARHVDWRATAHTGELQVREFAREQEHLIEVVLDLDAPEEHSAWFERAVDCCAFLAWRIAQRGARIRFRTQTFDACLPEECDIYAILKYLALVEPVRGKPFPSPDDDRSYQVVFTPVPARADDAGFSGARVLGLDAFPGPGSDGAAAREELRHGGGKHPG